MALVVPYGEITEKKTISATQADDLKVSATSSPTIYSFLLFHSNILIHSPTCFI